MQAPHFLKLAVITHPTFLGGLRVDVGHVLLVLFWAFVGAAAAYLEAEPTTALVTALTSWSAAKPLLIGALLAGAGAVVNQAKQSFLTGTGKTNAVPPAPPALTVVAFCLLALCLLLPSCTPAKQAVVASTLEAEAGCVTNQVYNLHQTDAIVIIEACGPQEGAVILSLLDGLFASQRAASLPPAQLEALKASAHGAAAKYPRPAP